MRTLRDYESPYTAVYEVFHKWWEEGKVKYAGEVKGVDYWCSYDIPVMKFLGYLSHMRASDRYEDRDISFGTVKLIFNDKVFNDDTGQWDWILGPHAYTLFRAKLTSMDPEIREAFGLDV